MSGSGENVICPSCNKLVDDGIFCEGFCKCWHHVDCASLSDEDFSKIQALGDKVKWFCAECDVKVNRVLTKISDPENVIGLDLIVSNLINIVKGLGNDNLALYKRIDDISQSNISLCSDFVSYKQEIDDKISSSFKSEKKTVVNKPQSEYSSSSLDDHNDESSTDGSRRSSTSAISASRVVDSVNLTEGTRSGQFESKHVSSVSNKTYADKIKQKGKKASGKKEPIIGSRPNSGESLGKIRAVEKREWIFVSRLAPEVTIEDLQTFLKDSKLDCECVELRTKFNSYKSFKVGVQHDIKSKLLCSEFWPSGTLVREFIPKWESRPITSRTFLARNQALYPAP